MTAFVLIPGAGGAGWYWHRLTPLLEAAGHEAIAVDLPGDDERSGIHAYADLVTKAVGGRKDVSLVAQSMGAFTAALVGEKIPISRLVFVNAMIPIPGETAGEWWGRTGAVQARRATAQKRGYSAEFDLFTYFLHDLPKDVVGEGERHQRPEANIAFTEPVTFDGWPKVPTFVVVGKDDRFFPSDFQARVARERLGMSTEEIPGGHLVALSQPRALADVLLAHAGT